MLILSPLYGRKARICANFTRFDCLLFGYYSFPRKRIMEIELFRPLSPHGRKQRFAHVTRILRLLILRLRFFSTKNYGNLFLPSPPHGRKKAFAFRNTRRHFKPPKQTIICRKDNGLHSRAELLTFSPRRLKGDTRLPPNASLSPNRSSLLMELVNGRVLCDRLILFYYIRFR